MTTKLYALALGLAGLAFGGGAAANVITLTPVTNSAFQLQTDSPCVIGADPCKSINTQAGLAYTSLPNGNPNSWDLSSPSYNGSDLFPFIGANNSLLLGLNINEAVGQGPQTLTLVQMLVNGVVVDTYTGSPGNVPDINNGLGWADYLLGNFSSFLATDKVQFHVVFDNANDGPEILFLTQAPGNAVPEPATLALLGLGLLGACFARRRRS